MVRKNKRVAKFDGSEPRRCDDIKEIEASEIDPKSIGTFDKQAPSKLKQFTSVTFPHVTKSVWIKNWIEASNI